MLGGMFGAALMALLLPVLRPMMLYIGSPELLAFAVLGISMVAVLSGSAPLRGLAAGCIGLMISMVGSDPQTGTLRWTLDSLYLWEGARSCRSCSACSPCRNSGSRDLETVDRARLETAVDLDVRHDQGAGIASSIGG